MKINTILPGKYVIAVSGGVDSVVLLDVLSEKCDLELTVAHFDHGIRSDSDEDPRFVAALAQYYGFPYKTLREELGAGASEANARERRYRFLKTIVDETGSLAILTAHHQDDLIETACLNMLRGTKRRGLVSLRSTGTIQRPLLNVTKREILEYAVSRKLEWREDSTNVETVYLRNKLRKKIARNMTDENRAEIACLLKKISNQNDEIGIAIDSYLYEQPKCGLYKAQLLELEPTVAYEIVAAWLRLHSVSFDTNAIVRIINGARNLQKGSQIDVQGGWYCQLAKDKIILRCRSSV